MTNIYCRATLDNNKVLRIALTHEPIVQKLFHKTFDDTILREIIPITRHECTSTPNMSAWFFEKISDILNILKNQNLNATAIFFLVESNLSRPGANEIFAPYHLPEAEFKQKILPNIIGNIKLLRYSVTGTETANIEAKKHFFTAHEKAILKTEFNYQMAQKDYHQLINQDQCFNQSNSSTQPSLQEHTSATLTITLELRTKKTEQQKTLSRSWSDFFYQSVCCRGSVSDVLPEA